MAWRSILPPAVATALGDFSLLDVTEVRLRVGFPAVVVRGGRNFPLPGTLVTAEDLANTVHKAADYALYAVLDQLVHGFITVAGGVRVGIAGEVVTERGQVVTIKNFSSLCLRSPHQVPNCSAPILAHVFGATRPLSTLIIAPPGAGKTTLLRDLAGQVARQYPDLHTLILDERGELVACAHGEAQLPLPANCDVITGGDKLYGFTCGVRALRPDCVVTDELVTADDWEMVRTAVRSGVVVFASVHATSLAELLAKPGLGDLLADQVFARYVELTAPGQVRQVYDQDGSAR